jgi:hypothetical protein
MDAMEIRQGAINVFEVMLGQINRGWNPKILDVNDILNVICDFDVSMGFHGFLKTQDPGSISSVPNIVGKVAMLTLLNDPEKFEIIITNCFNDKSEVVIVHAILVDAIKETQ